MWVGGGAGCAGVWLGGHWHWCCARVCVTRVWHVGKGVGRMAAPARCRGAAGIYAHAHMHSHKARARAQAHAEDPVKGWRGMAAGRPVRQASS